MVTNRCWGDSDGDGDGNEQVPRECHAAGEWH